MITRIEPIALPPPPSRHERSEGIHLSRIIRAIALETGLLKPDWFEELSLVEVGSSDEWWNNLDPVAQFRIGMGLAWEEWYIPQLDEVVDHPGEMELDGIYMTPDGEELTAFVVQESYAKQSRRWEKVIHEVKCTYKSTKTVGWDKVRTEWDLERAMQGEVMWQMQGKGYCKAANTPNIVHHILFVCGDYSWPMRPQGWRFHQTYSQAELDTNWNLITDYRDEWQRLQTRTEGV